MKKVRSLGKGILFQGARTLDQRNLVNGMPALAYQYLAHQILGQTERDGGGTFVVDDYDHTRHDYSVAVDGYAVGGAIDTVKVPVSATYGEKIDAIARFIHHIPRGGDLTRLHYLGTWIDDGILYIDAVDVIEDEEDAFNLARERGEIAVYHGPSDTVITVERYFEQREREEHWMDNKLERLLSETSEDVVFVASIEDFRQALGF